VLPELPRQEDEPPTAAVLFEVVVRCPLVALGWTARKMRIARLRQWCARMRIRLDRMVLCRAGCSFNQAITELGLAVLETGAVPGAIECLRRSWHVHPCPHNVSSGLSPNLWIALAGISEAEPIRMEYEKMARLFAPHFGRPRTPASLSDMGRAMYRALRDRNAEHRRAVDRAKERRD
jgi:hypothetical protein